LGRGNQTQYDDKCIQNILSNLSLPLFKFKEEPKDLFLFFESLARFLLDKLTKQPLPSKKTQDKLEQEFFIVCTLNALFGNPNIHLVQLHDEFRGGINNYHKMRDLHAGKFTDSTDHLVNRKRRNALTEVLRFICMLKVKPQPQQGGSPAVQAYELAMQHMLNGDIQAAVKVLNGAKAFRMAQLAMAAVSNRTAQQ
jgi:hypothetical protein